MKFTRDEILRMMAEKSVGTFRIVNTPEGVPSFQVGDQPFDNPADALDYIKRLGLRSYHEFQPNSLLHKLPASGPSRYTRLEYLASKGYRVQRFGFDMKKVETINALEEELTAGGVSRGFIVPNDPGTLLRVYKGEKELTTQGIQDALEMFAEDSPKTGKRATSIVAAREISANITQRGPITIGTFNPTEVYQQKYGLTSVGAQMSEDAISRGNPQLLGDIAREMERHATGIEGEIAQGLVDPDDIEVQVRKVQAIRNKVDELIEVQRNGGRFNVRAMGLDLIGDVSEELRDRVNTLGQLRGDILFGKKSAYIEATRRLLGSADVLPDVLTAEWNLKKDFGLLDTVTKPASFISLEAHHVSNRVWTNIQHFIANPDLYGIASMREHTEGMYDKFIGEIMDTGALPRDFEMALRNTLLKHEPLEPEGILAYAKQKKFAEKIIGYVDKGRDIREDRTILSTLTSGYREFLEHGEEAKEMGLPSFMVPDSVYGYLTPYEAARDTGLIGDVPLKRGEAAFHESIGWILHQADSAEFSRSFGGSDFDDLMQANLRWDEAAKDIRVILSRSPTGMGELAVLKLKGQAALDYLLKDRIPEIEEKLDAEEMMRETIGERKRAMRRLNRAMRRGEDTADLDFEFRGLTAQAESIRASIGDLQQRIRERLPGVMQHVPDSDVLARRSIYNFGQPKYVDYFKKIEAKAADDIIRAQTLDDQFARARTLAENAGMLGKASNLRAIVDSIYWTNNPQVIERLEAEAGKRIPGGIGPRQTPRLQVEELENIIDALINPAKSLEGTNLDDHLRITQETLADLLVAHPELRLDRMLLEDRLKNQEVLSRRMAAYGQDLESRLLEPDDPRAVYSQMMESRRGLKESVEAGNADLLSKSGFQVFDEMFFTQDELTDAKRIFDVQRDAFRYYGKMDIFDYEGIGEDLGTAGVEFLKRVDTDAMRGAAIRAETQRAIAELFEDDMMGDRARNAVMAFMQQYGNSPAGSHTLSSGLLEQVRMHALAYADVTTGRPVTPEVMEDYNRVFTREQFMEGIPEESPITPEIRESLREPPGSKARARRARGTRMADDLVEGIADLDDAMPLINMDTIKRIWGSRSFKAGALAIGAMAIGAEVYQRNKDRSYDNLEGPPMLPGGSFYEDYAGQELPSDYQYSPSAAGGGMTYNIRARGNFDPNQFMSQAEMLTGGTTTGTIYSAPSNRFQTPYDAMGDF